MTWNTPLGQRTLDGPEQHFFKTAMRKMSKLLIELSANDNIETGVPVFDSLSGCQQLVMLDYVRGYLFEETSQINPATADVEGTAGAVISFVRREIAHEIDTDKEVEADSGIEPRKQLRKMLYRIFKPYEWRINSRLGIQDWHSILDHFHDRVLHTNDYLLDDANPNSGSQKAKVSLAANKSYYSEVSAPELDAPEMLQVVRRLLA